MDAHSGALDIHPGTEPPCNVKERLAEKLLEDIDEAPAPKRQRITPHVPEELEYSAGADQGYEADMGMMIDDMNHGMTLYRESGGVTDRY